MSTAGFKSIFHPNLFQGHNALVTGGGTGIGRCIAHELASLGAHVILTGRRTEPLESTAQEIRDEGGQASFVSMNIREEEQVDSIIQELVEKHGPLHLLVNNAGGQFASPAAQIRPKGWRAVVDTNLNGTFFVSQAAFKHSMSKHGGSIVNIVADMWNGFPGMSHTGAARAGVVNLTMSLAQEWAFTNTRINSVAPGYILSSGLMSYPPMVQQLAADVMPKNPSGRIGTESEVSAAVCFLLSPAAAYITGETVKVDGGSSLFRSPILPVPTARKSTPFHGFQHMPELPPAFQKFLPATDDEDAS